MSDDVRFAFFNDGDTLIASLEVTGHTTLSCVGTMGVNVEMSATRPGLSQVVSLYNYTTSTWDDQVGVEAPTTDTLYTYNPATPMDYVGPSGEMKLRVTWGPINDEDPSQDGWLHYVDLIQWQLQM